MDGVIAVPAVVVAAVAAGEWLGGLGSIVGKRIRFFD